MTTETPPVRDTTTPTNHCETCLYWRNNDTEHFVDLRLRDPVTFEIVPDQYDLGKCTSPKMREYERPEEDGAATVDGSEYFSTLITGPKFGCVNHSRVCAPLALPTP